MSRSAVLLRIEWQEGNVLNRFAGRLTAGVLALVLGSSAALHAQIRTLTTEDPARATDTSAVVIALRDPEPRPRPLGDWKIDDINRARWIAEDAKKSPQAEQQSKKKSHHALAVILIGIGGAVAGGYFGSTVQGSLCECDNERATGAAYGALFGGAIAGIIAHTVMR